MRQYLEAVLISGHTWLKRSFCISPFDFCSSSVCNCTQNISHNHSLKGKSHCSYCFQKKCSENCFKPYHNLEQPSLELLNNSCNTAQLFYLSIPYNSCIVASNINTSITCLIVQSKNGAGFNPCHLFVFSYDLKLVH